jgi:hypothetical protein
MADDENMADDDNDGKADDENMAANKAGKLKVMKTQALQPAAKPKARGSRGAEHATPWAEGVASGVYDAVDDSSEEDRWPKLS